MRSPKTPWGRYAVARHNETNYDLTLQQRNDVMRLYGHIEPRTSEGLFEAGPTLGPETRPYFPFLSNIDAALHDKMAGDPKSEALFLRVAIRELQAYLSTLADKSRPKKGAYNVR